MHMTPEDQAIGRENFYAAIGHAQTDRAHGNAPGPRKTLEKRIVQRIEAGGAVPGGEYFGYGTVAEPLRVGVIGTGDEGSVLLGALNPDYITVKAIADIRPYNQYRAFHGDWYSGTAKKVRPGLVKVYGYSDEAAARKDIKVYGPWQDLIKNAADDGIEAVIIALPLHLHAPVAIAAMKAGLHVLTEKLMAHDVGQCKDMARVAAFMGKHLATGHQRHYSVLYDRAVQLIKSGALGDLHFIRAQWHRGNLPGSDSWQQPMPPSSKPTDPQAHKIEENIRTWEAALAAEKARGRGSSSLISDLTKKILQGQNQLKDASLDATKYDYHHDVRKDADGNVIYDRPAMEELIRWRLWDRTGGGLMAELGSHQLDAASIFIAAMHAAAGGDPHAHPHPISVNAVSNRSLFRADRDVDDHVTCLFEFPGLGYDSKDPLAKKKKIGVYYSSINGNGYGGYGEEVLGTTGTLLIQRETEAMLYKTSDTASSTRVLWSNSLRSLTVATIDKPDRDSAVVGEAAVSDTGRGYQQEIEHWAWCIRQNPDAGDPDIQPRCYPKVAMGDAIIALTSNISARDGRQIEFEDAWFDVNSDETPDGSKPSEPPA